MPSPAPSSAHPVRPAAPLRWYVPVRGSGCGWSTLRLFRTPLGERTAVAFTTPERLHEVLGQDQPWQRLGDRALRQLVAAVGVSCVTVDPTLSARPADRPRTGTRLREAVRTAARPAVTTTAALA